jgi:hypothetical protein
MPSYFTQAQIDALTAARDAARSVSETALGAYRPAYDLLFQLISNDDAPASFVDHNSWMWVSGARYPGTEIRQGPMGKIRASRTPFRRPEQAVMAGKAGEGNCQNGFAAALGQVEHPLGLLQSARQAAHIIKHTGKLGAYGIKGVVHPPAGIDGAIGK